MMNPIIMAPRRKGLYSLDVSALSGLSLWYDFNNAAGTSLTGTDIDSIIDLSSTEGDAASSGAADAQLVTLSTGKKVGRFNGTNNYYTGDTQTQGLLDAADNVTGFIVAAGSGSNASADALIRFNTGASGYALRVVSIDGGAYPGDLFDRFRVQATNSDAAALTSERTSGSSLPTYPTAELHIISFKYTRADGVLAGRTAGVANDANGNGTDDRALANDTNAALSIGGTLAGGNLWQGDIAEIIICKAALSDAEIANVERHLANKWKCYTPNCDWLREVSALRRLRIQQGELAKHSSRIDPISYTVGSEYATLPEFEARLLAGDTLNLPTATQTLARNFQLVHSGLGRANPITIQGNGAANSIVDGNGTYNTSLGGQSYLDIKGIRFTNTFGDGSDNVNPDQSGLILGTGVGDGGQSILIQNCKTDDTGSNGIYTDGASYLMIDSGDYSDPDTEIDHGGWHPIYIAGGNHITVQNCTITGSDSGSGIRAEGDNINIEGNIFSGNNRDIAIYADPGFTADNIRIHGNTISGTDSTQGGYNADDGTSIGVYGSSSSPAVSPSNVIITNNNLTPGANTVRNIKITDGITGSFVIEGNTSTGSANNADIIGEDTSLGGLSRDELDAIGSVNATHFADSL